MRLGFSQELRQVQKQILAPRMILSMEILQLPITALEERIDQELSENPVLELRESDPDLPEEQSQEAENPDAPTVEERELVVDENKDNADDFERLLNLDEEWPDHFDEHSRPSRNRVEEDSERKHDAMANMASRPLSLQSHLEAQLGELDIDPVLRLMAVRIIYSLDANGYLQGRIDDLLDPNATDAERQLAREALAVVQRLDPPGVGAHDLRECLLLQLTPDMDYYDEIKTLVGDHLEDLQHNRMPVIQRKTGYSIELIQTTLDHLRKLNPKPGAAFSGEHVPTVTPDVFVEPGEDGAYKIRLEDGHTPSLYISKYYRQRLQSGEATDAEREFIRRKVNSAQWLIESIEQRRNTLAKVAQAIVDHQRSFLEKGPEFIEPLKMQQIADKVGVHVTTISRAVDDKWLQTPRGLFPLRKFFVGGTTSADGEEVAWDAIRVKLREVIDAEDKQNPYSDDELVEQLGKHGLTVARRTITKYRKAMDIPSSRQRKDWSMVAAANRKAIADHDPDHAEHDAAEAELEIAAATRTSDSDHHADRANPNAIHHGNGAAGNGAAGNGTAGNGAAGNGAGHPSARTPRTFG
jgi:RNA polymerase sigma-54 factor